MVSDKRINGPKTFLALILHYSHKRNSSIIEELRRWRVFKFSISQSKHNDKFVKTWRWLSMQSLYATLMEMDIRFWDSDKFVHSTTLWCISRHFSSVIWYNFWLENYFFIHKRTGEEKFFVSGMIKNLNSVSQIRPQIEDRWDRNNLFMKKSLKSHLPERMNSF